MKLRPPILRSPGLRLGIALLAPFLPILLAPLGRVLGNPKCDNPWMFYYINDFAGHCWRQGVIPLWNPHIMLGLPFLGEGQAALFHPLSWLFILLPTGVAINWLIALSFLLTGLFFYGYLRALELEPTASCFGALVWCYSNVLISRIYAGHLTILLELIEMPLILMLWERYRRAGKIQYMSGITLAYAALILAAYPQFLFIFSLFFLLYVLLQSGLEIAARRGGRAAAARQALRTIALLGVFILLGIGIGAVQLLPSADFALASFRRHGTYQFCTSISFQPENLLHILAPRFFGFTPELDPGRQYWGQWNYWEMSFYIGILPLILVLPGLAATPRRRRVVLLAAAAVFFVIALGRFTPLYPLLYHYVPFFNVFRSPSKYMVVTEFCLVTLSAHGAQALLRPAGGATGRRRLLPALAGGGGMLVLILSAYLALLRDSAAPNSHWRWLLEYAQGETGRTATPDIIQDTARWAARELLRSAVFVFLSLGLLTLAWSGKWRRALAPLLFAVALGDLLCVFFPMLKTYDEAITRLPEEIVAPLRQSSHPYPPRLLAPTLSPNIMMHYGFSSPSGYTGNTLMRYNNFINAAVGQTTDTSQVRDPIMDYTSALRFLGYDAGIVRRSPAQRTPGVIVQTPALALVHAPEPFPRAFLAASPHAVAGPREALAYVLAAGPNLLNSPAVEQPVPNIPDAPLSARESVAITGFTPTRVELEASAAQPRVLVLGEMFEKNWTATVGGKPARIFPANYLFRGVEIPPGPSRVVFVYRPAAFRWGAALSLLSLAAVLAFAFRSNLRRLAVGVAASRAGVDSSRRHTVSSHKHPGAHGKRGRTPKVHAK